MAAQLSAVAILALDPHRLAEFWSGLLGRDVGLGGAESPVLPGDGTAFSLRFVAIEQAKAAQNRAHLELTSESLRQQEQTVARALALGGRQVDVGQLPHEEHVVLADPEGNEFCVIEPGNNFLAGCGYLGSLACDGTHDVGCFWRDALGWPLVWDEGEETAIQSPYGGPKITWGGTPLMPRHRPERLQLELAPDAGADQRSELDRLVALGAAVLGPGPGGDGVLLLTDPDGNEFRLTYA